MIAVDVVSDIGAGLGAVTACASLLWTWRRRVAHEEYRRREAQRDIVRQLEEGRLMVLAQSEAQLSRWQAPATRRPVPDRDAFLEVVGVTVEAWIAADTPEKFAALLEARDRPCTGPSVVGEHGLEPSRVDTYDVLTEDGRVVRRYAVPVYE